MTNDAGRSNLRMTARWLRIQALVALLLALGLSLADPVAGYSSLFGSLAAYLPALLFASMVARRFGPDSAAFLRAALVAEAVKWLLTASICVAVFVWVRPLAGMWFFVGMGMVLISGWAGLIFND